MKITHKMIVSTLVGFLGAGTIAGVGIYGLTRLNNHTQQLVEHDFLPLINVEMQEVFKLENSVEMILNADRDAYQAALAEKQLTLGGQGASREQIVADYRENVQQVSDRMAAAAKGLPETAAPVYRRFTAELDDWRRFTDEIIRLTAKPETMAQANALNTGPATEAFNRMRNTIDEITELVEHEIEQVVERINHERDTAVADTKAEADFANGMVLMFGVIAATVLAAAVVTNLLISRSVVKPVKLVTDRLRDIAEGEGDLTKRVNLDSKDEVGDLARLFDTFVGKVHDLVAAVAGATHEVAGAATQIAASSEEMATGMSEQTQQVTQISAAIEEMSASVIEVARKSGDAANSASESGQVAEQGGRVVKQTIDGMQAIKEAVTASATSVQELGKRGEQIGQIIAVINDIADQTNLLALNAAIEAARAGEHGRGFAVVADEVRKLADRTTKATEEIAQSITAIQTETTQAVERMNSGTAQVNSGVELASEAGTSLEQIVSKARDVASMIQSIAAAAEQQSSAGEEISRNVDLINSVSRQAAEGAGQAAIAATSLSDKAEQLQRLVGQFKIESQRAAA